MTATTSIRWAVTKHLVDLLRDELAPSVLVEPGWPGERVKPRTIWVHELDGDVSIPVMQAGRKQRDDQFTIPFEIRVTGETSLDRTMEVLSELVAAIEDVLADDPGLDNFDGLIAAEITEERMTADDTGSAGRFGFAEVVVSCHSRLT